MLSVRMGLAIILRACLRKGGFRFLRTFFGASVVVYVVGAQNRTRVAIRWTRSLNSCFRVSNPNPSMDEAFGVGLMAVNSVSGLSDSDPINPSFSPTFTPSSFTKDLNFLIYKSNHTKQLKKISTFQLKDPDSGSSEHSRPRSKQQGGIGTVDPDPNSGSSEHSGSGLEGIAGEHRTHAEGIADAISARILERRIPPVKVESPYVLVCLLRIL